MHTSNRYSTDLALRRHSSCRRLVVAQPPSTMAPVSGWLSRQAASRSATANLCAAPSRSTSLGARSFCAARSDVQLRCHQQIQSGIGRSLDFMTFATKTSVLLIEIARRLTNLSQSHSCDPSKCDSRYLGIEGCMPHCLKARICNMRDVGRPFTVDREAITSPSRLKFSANHCGSEVCMMTSATADDVCLS